MAEQVRRCKLVAFILNFVFELMPAERSRLKYKALSTKKAALWPLCTPLLRQFAITTPSSSQLLEHTFFNLALLRRHQLPMSRLESAARDVLYHDRSHSFAHVVTPKSIS